MSNIGNKTSAVRLLDQRVLLVDDSIGMRKLVKSLLYAMGIGDIEECSDGAEAYDKLQTWRADLIITAWEMKPVNGIEFTRMLRQELDSPCPEINLIMLSARTLMEEVLAARDAGITEFLAKPISAASLYTRIMSVLQYPRPFIRCPIYIGPCRRRKFPGGYDGDERREEDFFVLD